MTLFVTSTGTEQGKTYVSRLIAFQNAPIYAIKPIISGYDTTILNDTTQLLEASASGININECSPWRFKAPLSPDLAAKMEGSEIDFLKVVDFCKQSHVQLIEGAGGVMSPITSKHTNLDLIAAIACSTLLVSSLYLGCISHILTALEVLKAREVEVKALILNAATQDGLASQTVLASLKPHLPHNLPIICLDFEENLNENWQNLPNIISLVRK